MDLENEKWIRSTIYQKNNPLKTAMLANELGANYLGVRFIDEGRGSELSAMAPTQNKMRETYTALREYSMDIERSSNRQAMVYDSPYYLFNENLYNKYNHIFKERKTVCPAGHKIVVSHKGVVSPCQMMMDIEFGNIVKDDNYTIYKGIESFFADFDAMPIDEGCKECPFVEMCYGGCKYYAHKNKVRGDPVCPLKGVKP